MALTDQFHIVGGLQSFMSTMEIWNKLDEDLGQLSNLLNVETDVVQLLEKLTTVVKNEEFRYSCDSVLLAHVFSTSFTYFILDHVFPDQCWTRCCLS